jgi:hypothetical protein
LRKEEIILIEFPVYEYLLNVFPNWSLRKEEIILIEFPVYEYLLNAFPSWSLRKEEVVFFNLFTPPNKNKRIYRVSRN